MSKKRRGLGGLAALGGAALLAMKLAKGDRKDAAPIEDATKRDSKSSSETKRLAETVTDMGGMSRGTTDSRGTTAQSSKPSTTARSSTTARPASRPAARPAAQAPAAQAPAVVPRAPVVSRAEGMSASGLPREARGVQPSTPTDVSSMMANIGTRPSFGITPGREVDPRVLNAMQRAGGMKKGGTVKKKSGGMVSKASKRADGCAVKGKTRGRMV